MLIVNGTEIQSVFYNGVDLDRVIYNGVVVFEKNQSSNIEAELIDFTYFKTGNYYVLTGWKGTYQGEPSTECIIPNYSNIKLRNDEKTIIASEKNKDKYTTMPNRQIKINFMLYNFKEEDLENLKIELSESNILKYNSYTYTIQDGYTINLTIILDTLILGNEKNIALSLSIGDIQSIFNFEVEILEIVPSSWEVLEIENCYPFVLNEDGFYENTNQYIDESISMCEVDIINPAKLNVYVDCIQFSETGYDYGALSKIDTPLSSTNHLNEETDLLQYSFMYENTSLTTVEYGPVEGKIYIKYCKDSGGYAYEDTFQFRIRIE